MRAARWAAVAVRRKRRTPFIMRPLVAVFSAVAAGQRA